MRRNRSGEVVQESVTGLAFYASLAVPAILSGLSWWVRSMTGGATRVVLTCRRSSSRGVEQPSDQPSRADEGVNDRRTVPPVLERLGRDRGLPTIGERLQIMA